MKDTWWMPQELPANIKSRQVLETPQGLLASIFKHHQESHRGSDKQERFHPRRGLGSRRGLDETQHLGGRGRRTHRGRGTHLRRTTRMAQRFARGRRFSELDFEQRREIVARIVPSPIRSRRTFSISVVQLAYPARVHSPRGLF